MASTNFVDGVTLIVAAWLNDVDTVVYDNFGNGTAYTGNLTVGSVTASSVIATTSRMSMFTGTAVPAGGTTDTGLLMSSTSSFGIFFGSGAPTLGAAKGSLYLRTDGSGTTNRTYINTDGGTTWTALTTVA